MSIPCSMRWPPKPPAARSPRNRPALILALVALGVSACSDPSPATAQVAVFDVQNHVENALQAARQLETLANQARSLANEARTLAASPYSHLTETTQTLREISDLALSVKGIAADAQGLQRDFERLYPAAVEGLDPREALRQAQARNSTARETAQDLARTAAELERLARGRGSRLSGAMSASQGASGQTAAIQSSIQVLAVLAEDLGSMRTIMLSQSRLMAEEAARRASERAASAEARRRFWGREATSPAAPNFDPYSRAHD